MKINIQQGSQILYIYIKVSSLVDSSGWSFDSKLKKKIKNANKNRRNNRKTGTGLIFLFPSCCFLFTYLFLAI